MSLEEDRVFEGKVIWFKKTYGFIQWEKDGIQQKDLFAYHVDLVMEGYKTLKKDQTVSFQVGKNLRGQDKAVNVRVVEG